MRFAWKKCGANKHFYTESHKAEADAGHTDADGRVTSK